MIIIRRRVIGYAMLTTGCLIVLRLFIAVCGFWLTLVVVGGGALVAALFAGGVILTTE